MNKKIIAFCASMTTMSIIEVLLDRGIAEDSDIVGILDDTPALLNQSYYNYKVIGNFSDILNLYKSMQITHFIIGIGSPRNILVKDYVYRTCLQLGLKPLNAIHKNLYISPRASIGEGNLILSYSTISCHSKIGSNCVIPPGVSILEDVKIGNNVQIHAHCFIGGRCIIEDNVYIGPGTTVVSGIHIGKNTVIGAGSLVLQNIAPNSFVFGSPAVKVRENDFFRKVEKWKVNKD